MVFWPGGTGFSSVLLFFLKIELKLEWPLFVAKILGKLPNIFFTKKNWQKPGVC